MSLAGISYRALSSSFSCLDKKSSLTICLKGMKTSCYPLLCQSWTAFFCTTNNSSIPFNVLITSLNFGGRMGGGCGPAIAFLIGIEHCFFFLASKPQSWIAKAEPMTFPCTTIALYFLVSNSKLQSWSSSCPNLGLFWTVELLTFSWIKIGFLRAFLLLYQSCKIVKFFYF